MELLQQFIHHWGQKQFISTGKQVLLAVSGGIDSMVMADLFAKAGIGCSIAHCNFQLRGDDADGDEELVRIWAEQHEIMFHSIRFDTRQKMGEWKKGVQETARILRYEWLDMIREQHGYAAIVTAHHANDNAETLLINLFKGTGIAGLHGIQEKNGFIVRPLLFAQRADIEQYAKENNIAFREDSSNASDNYLRNVVRHHIIPAAENWFPNAVQHVNDSIKRFAEAELIYRKAVEKEIKKLAEKRGKDIYVPILKLQKAEPLETICYELFRQYGFTSSQIPQIIHLFESETGHYIQSQTYRAIKNREFIIVTEKKADKADIIVIEGLPCAVETENCTFSLSFEKNMQQIPADVTTACIDMKRITFPLLLRRWKQGDYFYPLGMGMKKKKLSKYFKDEKLPLHQKENIWVLECDKRIVWIAGMRLDERFKVKENTAEILQVTLKY
jgi:tRNA(Ile)-lysidine synthase